MPNEKLMESERTLVLELITPLHIGSGERDGISDAGVVRDFNGLPGIPGTSIQGLLRAAVEEAAGEPVAKKIFGCAGTSNRGTGRGGRLSVSWGVVHDSHNQPVTRRITPSCRDGDSVLHDAGRPMLRDHVRLNGRGVAAKRGKFDELVVSPGHRFTVRLRFVTAPEDVGADHESDLSILENVLFNPALRLGGKTRRGLGRFRILGASYAESSTHTNFISINLSPETLWMFGEGPSEVADSSPVRGTRIEWDGQNRGQPKPVWIIPGSAVKGVLRHRTLFHANRLAGNFIDQADNDAAGKAREWLFDLFGTVERKSMPGKVYIDDVFLPVSSGNLASVQDHVSINPFSGGAKDSALFNDQPLLPDGIRIPLCIQLCSSVTDREAREALQCAVDDLRNGLLPLGAHVGRGYGIFSEPTASVSTTTS